MDTLVKKLRDALGQGQVISDPDELLAYECDGLTHYKARPRAVVFPRSTEEVSALLRLLSREGVPFAPRGAGTGLSGGALAVSGGVTVELARMRRILKVDPGNRVAVVETGVVNAQVSRAAAPYGLFYVPDPSSQASCTVGGNIAENAGGIHCLKYGTTVDHVLAARVVLSDGTVVMLGGACEGAMAPDLLGTFVGSEGTFGVATEATLRLTPAAPSVRTLLADFTDIDDASRAVSAVIAAGITPAALEMVDGATIRAVEQSVFAAGLPLDAEAALIVELDGLEAGIDGEVARVMRVCREAGARGVRLAADEAERKRLWAARKGAFGALGRVSPDLMLQDAVVPRSRLPEVLAEVNRIGARYRLRLANVFHAGDGNLHPVISYDARDRDEVLRVKEAGREIVETCVRAGGTITGEHGVGLDKSEYLPLVFHEDALRLMLQVRSAFDPTGLCNPGKVIPELRGCGEARAVSGGAMRAADGVWLTEGGAREAGVVRGGPGESGVGVGAARPATFASQCKRTFEHEPADLVASAPADMTLAEFNAEVGRAGQWLPLDPPEGDGATLGEIISEGFGGPQAFGYGPPRRHVLGMTVELADGRVVRLGGRVVKNVAGYDLCKLFTGNRGTLGVIHDLTLRLRPRPLSEGTLAARAHDRRGLLAAARKLVAAPLFPVAAEVVSRALADSIGLREAGEDHLLLVRFAGTNETVVHQQTRGADLLAAETDNAAAVEQLSDDEEIWRALSSARTRLPSRLAWRACLPPTAVESVLGPLLEQGRGSDGLFWHAGATSGVLRVFETEAGADGDVAARLGPLREAARAAGGSLVVERAHVEVAQDFDLWDLSGDAAKLFRRIREELDPDGLLPPPPVRENSGLKGS